MKLEDLKSKPFDLAEFAKHGKSATQAELDMAIESTSRRAKRAASVFGRLDGSFDQLRDSQNRELRRMGRLADGLLGNTGASLDRAFIDAALGPSSTMSAHINPAGALEPQADTISSLRSTAGELSHPSGAFAEQVAAAVNDPLARYSSTGALAAFGERSPEVSALMERVNDHHNELSGLDHRPMLDAAMKEIQLSNDAVDALPSELRTTMPEATWPGEFPVFHDPIEEVNGNLTKLVTATRQNAKTAEALLAVASEQASLSAQHETKQVARAQRQERRANIHYTVTVALMALTFVAAVPWGKVQAFLAPVFLSGAAVKNPATPSAKIPDVRAAQPDAGRPITPEDTR